MPDILFTADKNIESANKVKDIIKTKDGIATWFKKQLVSKPMPLELISPLQIRLLTVSCRQTLTSDGEKFEQ